MAMKIVGALAPQEGREKMTNLTTTTNLVKEILEEDKQSRNSDSLLYLKVLERVAERLWDQPAKPFCAEFPGFYECSALPRI